jgi:hypothetical protein
MVISINAETICKPEHQIRISGCIYKLFAVIYLGGEHFTARLINLEKVSYLYDGKVNGGCLVPETIISLNKSIETMDGFRKPVCMMYHKI